MRNKVYKVVHVIPSGVRVSAICGGRKTMAIYSVGDKTVPNIGKLFAFSSKLAAKRFSHDCAYGNCEIWESKATGAERPNFPFIAVNMVGIEANGFLELFWKGEFSQARRVLRNTALAAIANEPPTGTVLCSSITLLEKVGG